MTDRKNRKSIGEGYMESYAEIPTTYIDDDYLALKKLGGHRRLFSPGDPKELDWFIENMDLLKTAYGEERLAAFLKSSFGVGK